MIKVSKVMTQYSLDEYLNMTMDKFSLLIRIEVRAKVNPSSCEKPIIEKCLINTYSVLTHLITEYRRIRDKYKESKRIYDHIENEALIVAQGALSIKATVRDLKLKAHEDSGEELFEHREKVEKLEQRCKILSDHIDALKIGTSASQSVLSSMKVEWEASRA